MPVALLLRAAMSAQPATENGKFTVTAPPVSCRVTPLVLDRARETLLAPPGLFATTQNTLVARLALGTVPSFCVLIWKPVSVCFFNLPPPIDCLTIDPPLILPAA